MRNILLSLLLIFSMLYVPCTYAKVNTSSVTRKAQQAQTSPSEGVKRFKFMYFYPVRNTFPEEAGLFSSPYKAMHIRALAIYFLNMQISTKMYNLSATPSQLTLNFLGVLDGLVGAPEPFNMAKASSFYQENKKEVDAHFAHIREHSLAKQWPAPSQAQLNAWLKLLEKQPRHGQIATYLFPATNYLQTPISSKEVSPFISALTNASTQAAKSVVTYDTPSVSLEDFDSKIAIHRQHMEYTYRWVKDECFYSTYILGRLLATKITNKTLHPNTRLYVLSAYPKTGEYLQPANGQRFTLANGTTSLHWRYHTALLVVWPNNGTHTLMVLDSFLGGKEPLSLNQWLDRFHANTVFSAIPFTRNKKVEEHIQTPSKVLGPNVQVNGRTYKPHPVK